MGAGSRGRVAALAVTAGASAVITLAAVLAAVVVTGALTPRLVGEQCAADPTVSGHQGWCVEHRERRDLFGGAGELWIVERTDGPPNPRVFVMADPFGDVHATLQVTEDRSGLTVREPRTGVFLVVPPGRLASLDD